MHRRARPRRQTIAESSNPRRWIGPVIITAFLLLAVVIGLTPRGPKGNFIQSSEFQLAMDDARSGEMRALPGRMTVIVNATLRSAEAGYCRQYSLSGSIEGSGIVCRIDNEWQRQAVSDSSDSDGVLAATRHRLGAPVLSRQEEISVLAVNWRS